MLLPPSALGRTTETSIPSQTFYHIMLFKCIPFRSGTVPPECIKALLLHYVLVVQKFMWCNDTTHLKFSRYDEEREMNGNPYESGI